MHCLKPIIITRGAKWRNLATNNKNYVLFLFFLGETRCMNNKHASMSNFSSWWGSREHARVMSKRCSHLTKWLKQTRRNWWNSFSKFVWKRLSRTTLKPRYERILLQLWQTFSETGCGDSYIPISESKKIYILNAWAIFYGAPQKPRMISQ